MRLNIYGLAVQKKSLSARKGKVKRFQFELRKNLRGLQNTDNAKQWDF